MNKKFERPVVCKYLDISTSHISRKDADLLDVTVLNPLILIKYDEGHFVHVTDENNFFHQTLKDAQVFGYSKALLAILRKAWSKDCVFVRLDRDGTVYSDLPTFEW